MRVLVNYSTAERNYLPVLQHYLRSNNLEAIATSSDLSLGELVDKAKTISAEAIILCNAQTLANCVPGTKPTLDDYRGSLLRFSIPTLVINSLAHSHTIEHGSWLLNKDLQKLKTLNKPALKFSFEVIDTPILWTSAITEMKKSALIAYDIETKTINENEAEFLAGDTIITCCSWTLVYPDLSMKTYVLPLVDFLEDHYLTDELYGGAIRFLRAANRIAVPKAMHNGMYDAFHSLIYRAEPTEFLIDTMAMAHSEFSSLPKSLDFVASLHLHDYVQWKGEAEEASKQKDIQKYYAYNAKDTFTTARLAVHYLYNLPAYARTNYGLAFKNVYPFLYCGFEGLLIDQTKRTELREAAVIKQTEALKGLRTFLADENFNPGSWQQVQKYVYDVFGAADPHIGKMVVNGKKVKSAKGTSEKNLLSVGEQHPLLLRLTDRIISYREAQKAIGTYFDFLQKNGRLLYSINPFGTDTGRASAQSSSLWCGTQVQNIPPYAKAMLIADEGYELFEADNSQSEARCVAYLSQDLKLIAALEDKSRDFYTTLGTLFFGIPYEKVTKNFRNKILKKIVHGTNYVMGAATFIENAGAQNLIDGAAPLGKKITMASKIPEGFITLKQFASELLESYHLPFFRVREWYEETKLEIATTKMLKSPLGWTRYFFGDVTKDHNKFRSAVAHAPQNLSVTILNKGLWKVWQLTKESKGDLRLKAQIHDSIFCQVKIGREDIKEEILKRMDNTVVVHGRTLRIPVDSKCGKAWKES